MSKDIKDICIVIQSRLNSTRIPNKMLKPFAGTTLIDILLKKLKYINFPQNQIYFSVYEDELIKVGKENNINIFQRSKKSANEEKIPKVVFEWYNKLSYKYVVMISACNPFLEIETINKFIEQYKNSNREGAISVYESKNYFWNLEGKMINKWPEGFTSMNTKYVEPTKVAAHCMYGSRIDIIEEGYWVNKGLPYEPELITMPEFESFDIDEPWQFKLGEKLYESFNNKIK